MGKNVRVIMSVDVLTAADLPDAAIEDTIIDNSRWSIQHEIIFAMDGKFYRAYYQVGATENQDEGPWEYDDEVECYEVHQVEKLVKVWETVRVKL